MENKPLENKQYKEPQLYCKIGQKREEHQPDDIFELIIGDFLRAVDPKTYFVTSGEAVQKAKKLEDDLWYLAGQARKLRGLLEKAKGPAKWLETEWNSFGQLVLKRKWPRPAKPANPSKE